jgi:hypothetical protein
VRRVDDQREAGERERDRRPDPVPHRLLEHEARVQRDEHRRRVLDQERDADVEPPDRDQVEELHEREAGDPEDDEPRQLGARDAQRPRRDDGEPEREDGEGAERAELDELERREGADERHLRDGAVQPPQQRRAERHRVPEPRAALARGRDGERGLGHREKLYGGRP